MDQKPWWKSTTIQGAVIATLGALASILTLTGVVEITAGEVDALVSSTFTAIGSIMAIIGRFKAKTTIGGGG